MEHWVRIQLSTDHLYASAQIFLSCHVDTHKTHLGPQAALNLERVGINQILESPVDNNPFNIAPGVFFFLLERVSAVLSGSDAI